MLLYSKTSHRKIAHFPGCRRLSRVSGENIRAFNSFNEATGSGYNLCNCCTPVLQQYKEQKKEIDAFCWENGLKLKLQDGILHIISRHDFWRVIPDDVYNAFILLHKSTHVRKTRSDGLAAFPEFHRQYIEETTLLGIMEYINRHDTFRDEHPCTENLKKGPRKRGNSQKQRKKQKEERRRAEAIRVRALIEELCGN